MLLSEPPGSPDPFPGPLRGQAAGTTSSPLQPAQELEHALGAVHDDVGRRQERGRRLARVDGDAHRDLQPVEPTRTRRCPSCRRRRRARCRHRSTLRRAPAPPFPCQRPTGGRTSSTILPHRGRGPASTAASATRVRYARAAASSSARRKWNERLSGFRSAGQSTPRRTRHPAHPRGRLGSQLEAVLADDRDAADVDDPLHLVSRAPAHARDERVRRREACELGPGLVRARARPRAARRSAPASRRRPAGSAACRGLGGERLDEVGFGRHRAT